MDPTQKHLRAAIFTTLPADTLILRGFSGDERLSRPFRYVAELTSTETSIDFTKLIGKPAGIHIKLADDSKRCIHGIVSRFSQVPGTILGGNYKAEIVPWLWLLTRTADCRIYQQKTAVEIIEDVFKRNGFSDYKLRLSGSYRTREYCVQYRETSFDFVSRLMEEEGITYYFAHTESKHEMVLADSSSSHDPCVGSGELPWQPTELDDAQKECIGSWTLESQLQPAVYSHTDYNFTKPRAELGATSTYPESTKGHDWEVFEYPGLYDTPGEGEAYAKVRAQQFAAAQIQATGESNSMALESGKLIKLLDHPRSDQNIQYLITSLHCRLDQSQLLTGNLDAKPFFRCNISAIPATRQFRPERSTPRPSIRGPQTAVVVGPSGEEIHVDKYGRVKVLFPWDRHSKADENSSCWIRVSSGWAGKKWGIINTPRIGQEVIVEFLEGDPDRPIITGRVYNDALMPPYPLPDEKTKSTIKSDSSKGGGGFNELRIEDKKGSEQLFVHGEKDADIRIKDTLKEWVGNEHHLIIKKDDFEQIGGDHHSVVKGDRLLKTEGNVGETIKGDSQVKITGADELNVGGQQKIAVTGDLHQKTAANLNQEAGQKISIKAGMDLHAKAGMNYGLDAGMAVHIKGGMTVVIEAGVQLSLKAGGSFIDIGPAGVAISGAPLVMINSGGAAGAGGGSSPTAPQKPSDPPEPKDPKEADKAKAGEKTDAAKAPKPPKPTKYSPAALVLKQAAESGTPFCEQCEAARQDQQAAGGS